MRAKTQKEVMDLTVPAIQEAMAEAVTQATAQAHSALVKGLGGGTPVIINTLNVTVNAVINPHASGGGALIAVGNNGITGR